MGPRAEPAALREPALLVKWHWRWLGAWAAFPTPRTRQRPPRLGTPELEAPQAALPPLLALPTPAGTGFGKGSSGLQPSPHGHAGEAEPTWGRSPCGVEAPGPRQAPEARAGAGVDKQLLEAPKAGPAGETWHVSFWSSTH